MARSTAVYKVPKGKTDAELASPRARIGLTIFNDSDSPLYVRFGEEPCTPDDWSDIIPAHQSSGPLGLSYDGAVHGFWTGPGTGCARVTELLPE